MAHPILYERDCLSDKLQSLAFNYEKLFSNQIVKNFLRQEVYFRIFWETLYSPTERNKKRLDHAFQRYYTEVRLTSYLSKVIWRYTRDYQAKRSTEQAYYVLLMDQPLINEGNFSSQTYKEQLSDSYNYQVDEHVERNLLDSIENPYLYKGLQQLTNKQIQLLEYSFLDFINHTEIGNMLGVSQQSVSKTIGQALNKLRKRLEKSDIDGT